MPHTRSDSNDETPSPYTSLLSDLLGVYNSLSLYKGWVEVSQKDREVQSIRARTSWSQRKAHLFSIHAMGGSFSLIPYALFLPSDRQINKAAEAERTGEQRLVYLMGAAGEQLRICQGSLGRVTEAINQLDDETNQDHEDVLEQC
ncbi:hypothetical protein FRC08_003665 [Ceratobasidium sp. 394]|nr:hypothetical protein FRC08_003665 [Ceratobasidium sp. 394]KAG9096475.1 hypothetical protein FS749_008395 [Ceratobasidium sp. UAMH 11750]